MAMISGVCNQRWYNSNSYTFFL